MARQITLDDRELIEITDSAGNITGSFFGNPSDFDIIKRCDVAAKFFENAKIPDASAGPDEIYQFSDEVKKVFDNLLNSQGASDVLFKNANPLSPCADGTLYCQYVLEVLISFIEKEFNTRIKKVSSRVKKYTDKYTK